MAHQRIAGFSSALRVVALVIALGPSLAWAKEPPTKIEEIKAPPAQTQPEQLDNNRTYTNKAGNTVHSPARTKSGKAPDGASAQCRDGTYSFSQSRRGTCSHHGGVAVWL